MRLLLLLVVLLSCSHSPKQRFEESYQKSSSIKDALTGTWSGSGKTPQGHAYDVLLRQKRNGTFSSTFKVKYPQGVEAETLDGRWGVAGDYYFTTAHTSSVPAAQKVFTESALDNVYKILQLTKDEFQYEDLASGETLTIRRVSEN